MRFRNNKRFYLYGDGASFCNGIYDHVTDDEIPKGKLVAIINRLYVLEPDFVEDLLADDEFEFDYTGWNCGDEIFQKRAKKIFD